MRKAKANLHILYNLIPEWKEIFFKKNVSTSRRVIYCSRFDKDKGWDDFILAAKKLIANDKDLRFLMIGYGSQTNDVKEMVLHQNMQKYIEVLINPSQKKIAELYSESFLFIFPTRLAESLGLVALEAMSCGLPVVASNIGAIGEYVIENENGFLYNSGNVDELVSKVIFFLEKGNEEQLKMRDKAFSTAELYKDKKVEIDFIKQILKYLQ